MLRIRSAVGRFWRRLKFISRTFAMLAAKKVLTLCIHKSAIIVVDAEPKCDLENVAKEYAKLSKRNAHQEESANTDFKMSDWICFTDYSNLWLSAFHSAWEIWKLYFFKTYLQFPWMALKKEVTRRVKRNVSSERTTTADWKHSSDV